MDNKIRDAAEKLFNSEYEKLTEQERHVAHHITERTPISTFKTIPNK
jgi:DNA-binding MurR/RpiR family transcriptional regulator